MSSMSDERWRELSEQLDRMLELPESERAPWLRALEQQDAELAALIAGALAARERKDFAQFLQGDLAVATELAASASLIGRAVGPYIIDAEIGQGGMGTVWRAHRADGRFEGLVAIKFVHALLVGRAGAQRFRIEGDLLARLDHPNIARLIDAGVLEGTHPYLVLEYVGGQAIDAHCNQHGLTLEQRIRLFLDVLAAVMHAHSHLVVHRDIKPGNVFVTGDGTVKLLDFGIAKLLSGEPGSTPLTLSSAAPLTPQYAAPEQILGQPVTTATDVYALGLVLYVLLTGTHPLPADTRSNAELMHAVVTLDPPRPSQVARVAAVTGRSLEGDLDNILSKALKKAPAERYVSAAAFADDLRRFLSHEPVLARPDTLGYRTRKFVRRHRGSVLSAALTSLALLVTSAVALWQAHQAALERDQARLQSQRADTVGDFMSILLGDISRSRTPQAQRDYLDRAHALFELQHYADPMVRANLLSYLAARYQEFGYPTAAIESLQEAKSALKGSAEQVALAQLGCGLANTYDDLGQEIDADREIRAATILMDSMGAEVRPQARADCRVVESYVATARGENRRAIAAAQTSVSELEADGQRSGMEHVTALNALARANAFAGHNAIAVSLLRQIRASASEQGEPQTIGAWIHQFSQARDLLAGGRVLEAEQLSQSVLEASRRFGGADNARDATLLRATVLLALERTDEAAGLLLQEASPAQAPATSGLERVLARIELQLQQNDPADARRQWQLWRAVMDQAIDRRGIDAVEALRVAALLALSAGDLTGAQAELERAAGLALDADGNPTPGLRKIAVLRTETALRQSAFEQACASAATAIARGQAEAVDARSSAWIGQALLLRARCQQGLGQLDAMRITAGSALPHLQQNLGEQHPLTLRARALIAEK